MFDHDSFNSFGWLYVGLTDLVENLVGGEERMPSSSMAGKNHINDLHTVISTRGGVVICERYKW